MAVIPGVPMTSTQEWLPWAVMSAVFAAATAVFAKVGLQGVDSDLATLIRTFIIVLLLALFVAGTGKWSNPFLLNGKTWLFLGLSAFATGASWVCYFKALQLGPASLVAPIDKLSVVLVVLLAFLFLGERPSVREWIAVGLIGTGAVLLALKR